MDWGAQQYTVGKHVWIGELSNTPLESMYYSTANHLPNHPQVDMWPRVLPVFKFIEFRPGETIYKPGDAGTAHSPTDTQTHTHTHRHGHSHARVCTHAHTMRARTHHAAQVVDATLSR